MTREKLKRKIYQEGDVFAISLSNLYKSYERNENFIPPYAFGRLILFEPFSKFKIIETFKYYGEMTNDIEMIIKSGRLFEPIVVMDYLYKNRWRIIYSDKNFDKESAGFSEIRFSQGFDTLVWEGGKTRAIKKEETGKYKWMINYAPIQVEELIHENIKI